MLQLKKQLTVKKAQEGRRVGPSTNSHLVSNDDKGIDCGGVKGIGCLYFIVIGFVVIGFVAGGLVMATTYQSSARRATTDIKVKSLIRIVTN